jgi:hypothetical protein
MNFTSQLGTQGSQLGLILLGFVGSGGGAPLALAPSDAELLVLAPSDAALLVLDLSDAPAQGSP